MKKENKMEKTNKMKNVNKMSKMKKRTICLCFTLVCLLLSACSAPAPKRADNQPYTTAAPAPMLPETNRIVPAPAPAPTTAAPAPPMTNANNMDLATPQNNESYLVIAENPKVSTEAESMLTFSLKVDTAAYTNVARYIESGNLPPRDAVRTEELLNYFNYDENMVFDANSPFALYTELSESPFDKNNLIAFIRVKSEDIDRTTLPPSNLTFLIDTSGSMNSYDKLPLLQESFSLLVETLDEDDRVSIVTYAGSSAILLDGASGADKRRILSAINNLTAGGSTAGADGIKTAYALAEKNYLDGGNNRVILATDGDFNVGISSTKALSKLVSQKRGNGVYMSILGFGMGNIRDDIMETLSKDGNGNYSYINNLSTAKKVLVEELAANLFTIADDVKAQVEFNPENVKNYRLIGYENRALSNRDFADDTKDAGEIGVGTDVVVMFELELYGGGAEYKYGSESEKEPNFANEIFEVRIRYKDPGTPTSKLLTKPVYYTDIAETGSADFRFACSVAAFSHLLRDSEYKGSVTFEEIYDLAEGGLGRDAGGYRRTHLQLLNQYERLQMR